MVEAFLGSYYILGGIFCVLLNLAVSMVLLGD